MNTIEITGNINVATSAGSAVWGEISGTISDQTDLVNLIPTKTSDLTNDSGFITDAVTSVNGETGDVTISVPTATSELTNDSGFLTSNQTFYGDSSSVTPSEVLSAMNSGYTIHLRYSDNYLLYGYIHFYDFIYTAKNNTIRSQYLNTSTYILYTLVGDTSEDTWTFSQTQLASLSDIPTNTSDLTNDSGFLTSAVTSFNGSTGAVTYTAPVTSVNGNTGAVVLDASDISNDSSVSGTNVDDALDTLSNAIPTNTSDLTNDSGFVGATSASVTIAVADWSSNVATKTVSGVTASNTVIVTYDPSSKSGYTDADIYCSAQSADTLEFTCTTTPSSAVVVNVLILG